MSETQPIEQTPTGEIKDQSKATETKKETQPSTEQTSTTKETGSEKDKTQDTQAETKSLLNQKDAAPEKYDDFVVPEGFTLDKAVVEEIGPLFKDLGLSQANAQRLVDFYTSKTTEAYNAPYEAYASMRKEWQDAVRADRELGPRLAQVKSTIAKAVDSLGSDLSTSFREAMDLTGAGDNPAFIKAMYKFAERLTEGTHVAGNGPTKASQAAAGTRPSAAHALFPNLP